MTMPTKAQVDALVEAMPQAFGGLDGAWMGRDEVRAHLYLAAGLNADGSEKAKVQRATLMPWSSTGDVMVPVTGTWDGTTFTPDGGK